MAGLAGGVKAACEEPTALLLQPCPPYVNNTSPRLAVQAAEAAAAAAEAATAAGSATEAAEVAALQQRCKELEKKFVVARKKIQVGWLRGMAGLWAFNGPG